MTRHECDTKTLSSIKQRAESWGEHITSGTDVAGVTGYIISDYYNNQIGFAIDIVTLADMYNVQYNYEENENDNYTTA